MQLRNQIKVRPAPDLRVAFARWAVAQQPKVRTVSEVTFGVPAHLFPHIPEELLAGALVDGQPYIPASTAVEPPLPAAVEPGEVAEPLPETGPADAPPADELGEHTCPDCERLFDTPRGLAAHRRQAHPEEES